MSVEFVSDRMSYVMLRGQWCNIILYVPASTEVPNYNTEDPEDFKMKSFLIRIFQQVIASLIISRKIRWADHGGNEKSLYNSTREI